MSAQATPNGIRGDHWRRLCPSLRRVQVPDTAFVYHQGERCETIYVIVRGHLKLSRLSAQGVENTLVILPAGEVCGAPLTASGSADRAADTATAKGTTVLYRIPTTQFCAALRGDPDIAAFVVERLARRQSFLACRIEQLLNGDVRQRVATVLCELIGAYGGRCAHGHEVDVRLTQQELAEMTGATRPTVSTILNELRGQGVVNYTRRYICVENRPVLEKLSVNAHALF